VAASYTLQLTNSGVAATTATATISDTIPAGLTIGTLPAGCTAVGQTVTCTVPSGLAAGASTSFLIPVTPTLAAMPSVTNTATASGGGDSTCPAAARCSDTEGPTVVDAPQLTLTKTASASPWTVGVAASYTLQLTNSGNAATTAAATISDTIPAGLTLGTLPAGCTAAGQTVTCTVATGLAAGASTSFVIPVTPTLAAVPSVTNTATASGGGDSTCPAAARCSDTEGPTVIDAPALTLTKTASASPWTVGVAASYTLQLTNSGNAATTAAATISDTIPAGLTLGTLPAGCTAAGQTVTCTVATGLAAGASTSFVIPVTPTLAAVPSVTNTATASGGGDSTCPAAARCSDTEGPTVVDAPQLTLTKTASASPWTVGVAASYTLQLTNSGNAATTASATISDTIPTGLTLGTLPAGCTAAGQTVTCTVATGLAAGASTSFVIPVTPTAAATPGVTNTATASGGGDSTCPAAAHCSSSVSTSIGAPEVSVAKSSVPPSGSPVAPGDTIAYSVQVDVTGAALTQTFELTDTLDAQLTLISVTNGAFTCSAGAPLVCSLPAATPPGSYTLSYMAQVAASAVGAVGNVVAVSGSGGDPAPVCLPCSTSHPMGAADLQIAKSVDVISPVAGSVVTFTLALRNNGPDAATGVVVTDALPSGFTFVAATATQGAYAPPLWSVGTLASGATASLQIQARVNPAGDYRNVANVTAHQTDPVPGNNLDQVTLTPRGELRVAPVPGTSVWSLAWLLLLLSLLACGHLRRRGSAGS